MIAVAHKSMNHNVRVAFGFRGTYPEYYSPHLETVLSGWGLLF